MCLYGEEELQRALADAIAVSGEFTVDGEPGETAKVFEQFGLDVHALIDLMEERWQVYCDQMREEDEEVGEETLRLWLRAYVEGLFLALKLRAGCAA